MIRLGGLATAARGLRSRAVTSSLIFAVATLAVAAAVAGPTYDRAGQTSLLRDTAAAAPYLGRSYEVTETGPVSMGSDAVTGAVSADLGPAGALFAAPVVARQASAFDAPANEGLLLASSTGLCAHLAITGACPTAPGQVVVSGQLAALDGWRTGQVIHLLPWGALTIAGTYVPPAASDYWADQLQTYFPYEYGPASRQASQYDAVFAAGSTLTGAPTGTQGTLVVSAALRVDRLVPADVDLLAARAGAVAADPSLSEQQAIVTGSVPATMAQVRGTWSALAVSVLVVTLQLVAVAALLLWVLVTDATAARGPEIALAKLRGHGRLRLAAFALGEDAVLILAAVPAGAVLGWAATAAIGAGLLRAGTPIPLPALGWAAAGAAALGGLLAVAAGVRPTVRRSVTEQWGRSTRREAGAGWTFDAVVVTGAVAGVAEVVASGAISSAHQHPVALVVPGLVGLAAAVLAARALPVAAGAAARRRRRAGPASYLALRQLARRPGATRVVTVLGAAFALATFAVSAWSLARSNDAAVAAADVGAPTVVTVAVPPGADLAALVRRADPSGRHAAPVEVYQGGSTTTLAVDPARWARVALLGGSGLRPAQLGALDPPTAAPLVLTGRALRLRVSTDGVAPGTSIVADVLCPAASGPTPVQLPPLPPGGGAELAAALPPCAGVLEDLAVQGPQAGAPGQPGGTVAITGIDVASPGGWAPLPAGDVSPHRWYPGPGGAGAVTAAPGGGLAWDLAAGSGAIQYRDRPFPLPAIAARAVGAGGGPPDASGLNGRTLPVRVVATARDTPGAPGTGVVVDLADATRAAEGDVSPTEEQVWVDGDQAGVEAALRRQGVAITQVSSASGARAELRRSGPGLADTLLLAEAGAAAALAAGAAVVALYLLARRRRYELAALLSVGVPRRQLVRAVLGEQVALVSFGLLVGVLAGLASAAVLLGDVPEFATPPAGVALASFPPAAPLLAATAVAGAAVVAVTAAASVRMVAGTDLLRLREAQT